MKDTSKILPPYGAARSLRGQLALLAVEQRSGRMKTSAKTLCIGCTAVFLSGGSAWAQEACSTYVVVAGDNLRYIARQAYDDADLYRVIYEANVDTIGAKADLIEVGVTLNIPCDPRTVTAAAAAPVVALEPTPPAASPDAPAPVLEAAATPAAPNPAPAFPFRLVTGNGYAPFADEMLPGGGMFTQLVEMAIFRADPAIPYNMTYINDWQAHIDALLPSGAYDISFPWVRPDCEAPETLSAGDLTRCENFEFSAPFYEVVDGFFMPADSELVGATSYTAFEGKRICRPEGYTTGVLEAVGLTAGKIELLRPIEVTDCFEALAAGKADLVSIDAEVGDSAIAELGMVGEFTQNPHLMTLDSLHVIAHKSNPRAVQLVRMLDQGIVEMYESGEWYDIVSSALARGALQQ
jgi:polar amino acid transport system substrate-binding protein